MTMHSDCVSTPTQSCGICMEEMYKKLTTECAVGACNGSGYIAGEKCHCLLEREGFDPML